MNDQTYTSVTLLLRLRDLNDKEAWDDFVQRYVPKIYAWCRRYGMQEADASDVTQEVLGKFVSVLRRFEYDPSRGSFRGWLKTVTNNALRDFVNNRDRPGRGSGDAQLVSNMAAIQTPAALDELAAQFEAEAQRELLCEAEARVKLRIKPATWRAYVLTAVQNVPAIIASEKLGIDIGQVYVAKSRVIKMLRREIEKVGGFE